MSDQENINYDDFVVRVRPFRDNEGSWTGEIDLSVITFPDNDFDDEDYSQLIHFCTMMAATIPIMEDNESIRDLVHDFVMNRFDTEHAPVVEQENITEVEHDGNVIKINFNTQTKGSA